MLTVYCPRHRSRVLLSDQHIRAVHNTVHGIVIEVECFDGERILMVTGASIDAAAPAERVRRARRAVAEVRQRRPVPA